MALDGISTHFLAQELNQALGNLRIDKVQQPGRYDILLSLGGNRRPKLLLSANPAFPMAVETRLPFENPQQAPMFCMFLRKHLQGAVIRKVDCPHYERIIRFHIESRDEMGDLRSKLLIAELIGRHSNLLLLNEEGIILDCLVHVGNEVSRYRELLPARRYLPPPPQDKPLPRNALENFTNAPQQALNTLPKQILSKALLHVCLGLSPQLVHEILHRAQINGNLTLSALNPEQINSLTNAIKAILVLMNKTDEAGAYVYPEAANGRGDFHAVPLNTLGPQVKYPRLQSAITEIFTRYEMNDRLAQKRGALEAKIHKELKKKLKLREAYLNDIEDCANFECKRKYGELILSQLHRLPERLPENGEVTLIDYYDENQATLTLVLDKRYSTNRNANRLFKQYNKEKDTLAYAKKQLIKVNSEIDYLESLLIHIENSDNAVELDGLSAEMKQTLFKEEDTKSFDMARARNKKNKIINNKKREAGKNSTKGQETALPPRRYLSSDGLEILAGRNNIQNDRLSLRTASRDDLWFHIKNRPGTHVILRKTADEVPDRSLIEAAEIAAWLSRSTLEKKSNAAGALEIDYCPASHLRKPNGSKPGYVVYEGYNSVLVTPNGHPELMTDIEEAKDQTV